MIIHVKTLKALETQFKIAAEALVTQFEAATKAVLLAQEAAYKIKNDDLDVYRSVKIDNKIEPARGAVTATTTLKSTTTSPPAFHAPGIDTSIPKPCTAVPLEAPSTSTTTSTSPTTTSTATALPAPKWPSPPPFVAPPVPDGHVAAATIGSDGVVHLVFADGPAPVRPAPTSSPFVPVKGPPAFIPPAWRYKPSTQTVPFTTPWPMVMSELAGEEPKQMARQARVGLPHLFPWAPVFVAEQPPVMVETGEDEEVEDVPHPGDANDAWCPEADQTWEDEPEPVDPWGDVHPLGTTALPTSPQTVQAPPHVPATGGEPSREPNRRAARFVPDTASRRSNRVALLTDGSEPKLASVRSVELRDGFRPDLKALLSLHYSGPNGRPLMNYADVIHMDTNTMVCAILDHEAAKGWITRDFAWRAA